MPHDLERLVREFEAQFDRPPVLGARAPGRVNLIGEHTDYNGGLVLPCAIDRDTVALAARRDDGRVHVHSRELASDASFEAASPSRARGWIDYVQGVAFALREMGHDVPGLDIAIASEVPGGSGLSSSAALEVAVVTLFAEALGMHLSGEERARLAHQAESGFVGVACGVMDQLASALGREGSVLRIDCSSMEVRAVAVPTALVLLIVDSGVRHALVGGDYNQRRRECEAAFAAAQAAGLVSPGATTLRALDPEDLPALERSLDSLLFRRARHVITENERVDAVCAAFARGDLARAGAALRAGMASLRDDFDVSTQEIDSLCEIGDETPGVFGSRLTGAGFGGCTVHLVAREHAAAARSTLEAGFAKRYGRTPHAWIVHPSAGASVIRLSPGR